MASGLPNTPECAIEEMRNRGRYSLVRKNAGAGLLSDLEGGENGSGKGYANPLRLSRRTGELREEGGPAPERGAGIPAEDSDRQGGLRGLGVKALVLGRNHRYKVKTGRVNQSRLGNLGAILLRVDGGRQRRILLRSG